VLLHGMYSDQWLVFYIAALNEYLIRIFLTVYERTIRDCCADVFQGLGSIGGHSSSGLSSN